MFFAVRRNYVFRLKLGELCPDMQKSFLVDLCSEMKDELKKQDINENLAKVLSVYFNKIERSISQMQIR